MESTASQAHVADDQPRVEEEEGHQDTGEQEGEGFGANKQEGGQGRQRRMHQQVQHIEAKHATGHVRVGLAI